MSEKHLSDDLMKKISGLCSSQEDAELVLEFARECFERGRNAALGEIAAAMQAQSEKAE